MDDFRFIMRWGGNVKVLSVRERHNLNAVVQRFHGLVVESGTKSSTHVL